jgi:hypothetical protein
MSPLTCPSCASRQVVYRQCAVAYPDFWDVGHIGTFKLQVVNTEMSIQVAR